jgi:hypothetical protein
MRSEHAYRYAAAKEDGILRPGNNLANHIYELLFRRVCENRA